MSLVGNVPIFGPERGIGGITARDTITGFGRPAGRVRRPRTPIGRFEGGPALAIQRLGRVRAVVRAVQSGRIEQAQGIPPVSIWADIGRGLLGAVGTRLQREITGTPQVPIKSFPTVAGTAQTPPIIGGTPQVTTAGVLPGVGAIARGAGRVLTGRGATIGTAGFALGTMVNGGAGGCPSGFHPAKDGSGRCVRNRRMNVANPRAARRAIRRIKGMRKLLQDIEKQLPRKTTRARSAPAGHRAQLTHN